MTSEEAMPDPIHPQTDDPLHSPVNRSLRDYWLALSGDAATPPAWRRFDPVEIPKLLSHLVVVDVGQEPLRFRYRLVGTWITGLAGRDATGLDLNADLYGDRLDNMLWTYRRCVETAAPLATLGSIHFADKDWATAEHLFVPFAGEDGAVSKIVTSMDRLDGDTRLAGRSRDVELVLDWRR